jgi:hypothetical protein
MRHWFHLAALGGNQWHPRGVIGSESRSTQDGELGVVDGDDAGEAVEVEGCAADTFGSAEFEALGLQRRVCEDRFTRKERAIGVGVEVRGWERVVAGSDGREAFVGAELAGVSVCLGVVLDDGVEDVDGGGEGDGGGHAGVGVAAFFDGEHLLAGLGLGEPHGEDGEVDAVVAGDGDERGAGVAEVGEDAVVEVGGDGGEVGAGEVGGGRGRGTEGRRDRG